MKKKIGWLCLTLGFLLLCSSLFLGLFFRRENRLAGEHAARAVAEMKENLPEKPAQQPPAGQKEMPLLRLDDGEYLGLLSIPGLQLELPVLADWQEEKLHQAPCRYAGSYLQHNLVIAAHNYPKHFGRLSSLRQNDPVYFTDAAGRLHTYTVACTEILTPTQVESMVNSPFDLTLFTCTYGNARRVTVRCIEASSIR